LAGEGVCWYDWSVEGLPPVSADDQDVRFGEPGLHGFIRQPVRPARRDGPFC